MLRHAGCIARDVSEKLLQLDSDFSQWLGRSALRPEARLIMLAANSGPISVKEAMYDSSLSHRSFYMILDRLKEAGVIEMVGDSSDARVRRIYISEKHITDYKKIYDCFADIIINPNFSSGR